MAESVFAVFDEDVGVPAIADDFRKIGDVYAVIRILTVVGIGTLPTFYGDSIVVHAHVAVFNKDIFHHVKV